MGHKTNSCWLSQRRYGLYQEPQFKRSRMCIWTNQLVVVGPVHGGDRSKKTMIPGMAAGFVLENSRGSMPCCGLLTSPKKNPPKRFQKCSIHHCFRIGFTICLHLFGDLDLSKFHPFRSPPSKPTHASPSIPPGIQSASTTILSIKSSSTYKHPT